MGPVSPYTRRQLREAQARPQTGGESRTQRNVGRRSGRRCGPEMLTVAIRGPLAVTMRSLAERTDMSLAKLLGDMLLVYEGQVQGGYEPGTLLAQWQEGAGGAEG